MKRYSENVLRIILMIIFSIIVTGILNQNKGINKDYLLVPIVTTAAELFSILYVLNAFTTGNLVRRWANDSIFSSVFNFFQTKKNTSDEKTLELTNKVFGMFMLAILGLTIICELNFYFF